MENNQSQQLIFQAQSLQQQLQNILIQKETMNMQLNEISNTLQELEKSKETEVYMISGPVLLKTPKAEAKKNLGEKSDSISLSIKTLERGEKRIKEKVEELRGRISTLGPEKGGGG